MKVYPNILLISGTGRNVGKTTLGCVLIEHFSKAYEIISVKFSPHFHPLTDTLIPLEINDYFQLSIEKSIEGNKDSSRFLKAGASVSYYIQCYDMHALDALTRISELEYPNKLFVVESGGLGKQLKAGLNLLITNRKSAAKKSACFSPDRRLNEKTDFNRFVEEIEITDFTWKIKSNKDSKIKLL